MIVKSIFFNSIIVICFQVVFVFSSCKKENSLQQDTSNSDSIIYFTGAFIANEGDFGKSNSSVSYYSYKKDTVTEDIFTSANNRSLGDVLQSICVDGNNTYLVVNSSNKIEALGLNRGWKAQRCGVEPGQRTVSVLVVDDPVPAQPGVQEGRGIKSIEIVNGRAARRPVAACRRRRYC